MADTVEMNENVDVNEMYDTLTTADMLAEVGLTPVDLERRYRDIKLSFNEGEKYTISTSSKTGKKIITCILPAYINTASDNVYELLDNYQWTKQGMKYRYWRKLEVIGKAVCCLEDNFDEETGKKIARAKAESAAYRQAAVRIGMMLNDIAQAIIRYKHAFAAFAMRATNLEVHNQIYVNKLTGAEIPFFNQSEE